MFIFVVLLIASPISHCTYKITENDAERFRDRVRVMFDHAYSSYMNNAYPKDELCPLSCTGTDTFGGYSLTLIDSLDTLFVMGKCNEFQDAYTKALNVNFDKDVNVSVFETNIRVVGGLLAGHMVAPYCGVNESTQWPCKGRMLDQARRVADKLILAFDTPTGMPIGTVNLLTGVPKGETDEASTAGVGSFIVEFGALSRLTGDNSYLNAARRALDSLWMYRSHIDLVGNHVNVTNGHWTDSLFTIGAAVDSYLEYLLKGSILLDDQELRRRFDVHLDAIKRYAKLDNYHIYVSSKTGSPSYGLFHSLDAFFPGMLALARKDISSAYDILFTNHQLWLQYGGLPEHYDVFARKPLKTGLNYPLRPEHIESTMYLFRMAKLIEANNDNEVQTANLKNALMRIGVDFLTSIESQFKTQCGFAGAMDIRTNRLIDRMESFFLAETLKYLYLVFDTDNVIFIGQNHSFTAASNLCPGKRYSVSKTETLIQLDKLR
ncbi:hypothetical protein ACOME3_006279 [Neoechinorhynchus agilis]